MGAARADGRRRGRSSGRNEGHRLSDGDPGCERRLARRTPQCSRLSACVLPYLSRLREIFPTLGPRALSQSEGRKSIARDVWHVILCALSVTPWGQQLNLALSLLVIGTKVLYTPFLRNDLRCDHI